MIKKKKINLNLDSLNPFIEKIERLSKFQRISIYIGTLVAIIGLFAYFSYLPKFKELRDLKKEHASLEKKLSEAKRKARQLEKYRAEMEKAKVRYLEAKKALPEKKEIPSLLAAISQSGQDAGLEFLLFQPQGEVKKNFYAEIPFHLEIIGNYQNIGIFFENISNLSRIVNLKKISLVPFKGDDKNLDVNNRDTNLKLSCTAVTYKFIEAPQKASKGKKSKKKKKKKK